MRHSEREKKGAIRSVRFASPTMISFEVASISHEMIPEANSRNLQVKPMPLLPLWCSHRRRRQIYLLLSVIWPKAAAAATLFGVEAVTAESERADDDDLAAASATE